MTDKFTPIEGKEYLLTDQCGWEELPEEEKNTYNPYDSKRHPHIVEMVDVETGTIVRLYSGSRIKIIKAREI